MIKKENKDDYEYQQELWHIQCGVLHKSFISGKRVTLPEEIHTIAEGAFENASIEFLCIPHYVTLCPGAFKNAKFKEIALPEGVRRIEDHTFSDCENLNIVYGLNSVTYIGRSAFSGCISLTEWETEQVLDMIDENAFAGSGLTSLQVKCKMIGKKAFWNCGSLTRAVLEDVSMIDDGAFARCTSLAELHLNEPLLRIGDHAFRECTHLTSVALPQSLLECGYKCFADIQGLCVEAPNHLRTLLEDEHMLGRPEKDYKDLYFEGSQTVFEDSTKIHYW